MDVLDVASSMFLNMIDVLDVDEDVLNGWCVNDCTAGTSSFALGTTALELAALDVPDLDVGDLLVVEELVLVDVQAEALDELRRLLVVDVGVLLVLVVRLSPVELIDHVLHDFLVLELVLLLHGGELLEPRGRDAHRGCAVPRLITLGCV